MISRLLLPCLIAFSTSAAAQVSWYAGAAGGQSRTSIDAVRNREATLLNIDSAQTAFDDRDTAWKAFAGLRLNRAIALELAYVDLGRARTRTEGFGTSTLPYATTINRKVDGFGVDIVGYAPIFADKLELVGKVGVYRTRLDVNNQLEGNIVFTNNPGDTYREVTRREDTTHVGIGLQHVITKRWAVRLEYERFFSIGKPFAVGGVGTTGQADVDAAWVGVVAKF